MLRFEPEARPLATRMETANKETLRRPPGSKDVLELDSIGVGEEDCVVTDRILRVLSWSVENGNSKVEKSFVKSIDLGARLGREGKVVKAGRVAIVSH